MACPRCVAHTLGDRMGNTLKQHRHKRSPRFVGVIISIFLPIIVLRVSTSYFRIRTELSGFLIEFVLAELAVQTGISLWRPQPVQTIVEDILIAALAGVGAWLAVRLSVAQGGVGVGPGLLALLTAYILWLWPHARHRS